MSMQKGFYGFGFMFAITCALSVQAATRAPAHEESRDATEEEAMMAAALPRVHLAVPAWARNVGFQSGGNTYVAGALSLTPGQVRGRPANLVIFPQEKGDLDRPFVVVQVKGAYAHTKKEAAAICAAFAPAGKYELPGVFSLYTSSMSYAHPLNKNVKGDEAPFGIFAWTKEWKGPAMVTQNVPDISLSDGEGGPTEGDLAQTIRDIDSIIKSQPHEDPLFRVDGGLNALSPQEMTTLKNYKAFLERGAPVLCASSEPTARRRAHR